MVCTFSVVQPKALSAYKNIAFENLKLSNEKNPSSKGLHLFRYTA